MDHKQNYTTYSVDNDAIFSKVTRKLLKEIEQIPFQSMTAERNYSDVSLHVFLSLLYGKGGKSQMCILMFNSIFHGLRTQAYH